MIKYNMIFRYSNNWFNINKMFKNNIIYKKLI